MQIFYMHCAVVYYFTLTKPDFYANYAFQKEVRKYIPNKVNTGARACDVFGYKI